jgi:ATP-dependent DNA helicase RecQ
MPGRREMLAYAETCDCRWRTLLCHFGEEVEWERCGRCDNCLRQADHPPAHQPANPVRDPPRPWGRDRHHGPRACKKEPP